MLVHYLTRIPEFSNLPPQELRALAARAHVICMPPERWLLRDGRHMAAYLYLLRGSLQTRGPARKWRARKLGRLLHFYPGCESARTLSAVQVLRVDAAQREFLLNRDSAAAPQRVDLFDAWFLGHVCYSRPATAVRMTVSSVNTVMAISAMVGSPESGWPLSPGCAVFCNRT